MTPGAACRPHERTAAEVVRELGGDADRGLDPAEVAVRQARYGPNALPTRRRGGPLRRFALQFHNPLIYVLLASAAVTALLGERVDALVILGVVAVNAVVGFAQESRAERALLALAAMTQTASTVVRAGRRARVPSAELVPGDLVVLAAGDKVPADLRLITTRELAIDESALTGESAPVVKDPRELPGAALADRLDMAYSGTLATYGAGTGIVVATGAATELGLIQRLVDEATAVRTPLTQKIAYFSRVVTVAILALAVVTFAIGLARGQGAAEMLTAAVALAVGAIPEGLPAVVTITLAFGVARMVRRNAIVRRLPAVETLGSTTVICTDKTGTLTENQMTVTVVVAGGRTYEVTGTGYAPDGEILPAEDGNVALTECLVAGRACGDARVEPAGERWVAVGDPTEAALVTSAAKAGVPAAPARVDTVPFAAERQYMATLHEGGTVYVKGSVERVLAMCDTLLDAAGRIEPLDAPGADRVLAAARELGDRALRVLAFAWAEVGAEATELAGLPRLTFLGLQAMHDPPRRSAADAVRACQTAGIKVKMITGDHAATARAIGARLGLDGPVMTGVELAACADEELPDAADRTAVFARVSPEQKLRLVRALQRRSHVIAMTGDGVNDAPALKQADIGVAMGRDGTEVAKESADMVLTDDDFASIEAAVEEGRSVFDNLVKFIVWALPANVGLGLVLVAAIVAGTELPILPVQVLWLNMTAVLVLGLPFTVEPSAPDIMRRPPRDPATPLLTRALTARILLVSAVLLAGAFGLFHWELAQGSSLAVARTVVVNVFAVTLMAYVFNCLSLDRPMLWSGVRRNPWIAAGVLGLVAIQLVYTYVPAMNDVFDSAPLGIGSWLLILAVAVAGYAIVEVAKLVRPRSGDHR
ncbi:MAG TPA: HAD-IC family P-type ATPase [Streptosporangiaceae bacterium]